uniref:Uncharacterized protein n=1 Tax=Plectus sambesii TaxID=2011161 RepID=A0A914V9R5_9BILA
MNGKKSLMMLFGIVAILDCAKSNICASSNDVCAPTIDYDRACHCALIRANQLDDEWEYLKKKFAADFEDVQSKMCLMHLPDTVVEQLNQFFADDKTVATLDSEVFVNISTEYFVKMVAMPRARFTQIINQDAAYISETTRNMLSNCNNAICEQTGIIKEIVQPGRKIFNKIPMEKSVAAKIDDILKKTIADREFKAEKIVRIEFGDNVLLAYSASRSTFSLTKTTSNTKREFTDALLFDWKQYANAQLIRAFRTYYGHMMT